MNAIQQGSRTWQIESARSEIKEAMSKLEMLLDVPNPAAECATVDEKGIRAIRHARALRRKYFDARLFSDPAWDMLLDLYEAELGQRKISIGSLGLGADIPPTTALRWVNHLLDMGLVQRRNDPVDGRRVFISLSDKGLKAMQGYFAAAGPAISF